MKKWIKSMFSAEGDVSFKRVGSALALITCIIIAHVSTFTIYVCPEFIYDGLLILAGAGMGFTAVENITKVFGKSKSNESEG
jgi:hypothetical protein